jgi:hydroxyacylglutathione hydrolase
MSTPGHTKDSMSYVVTEVGPDLDRTPIVFTGDTLYTAGCGFPTAPEDMYESLMKLKSLPNETMVFGGHENGAKNLGFAKLVDPANVFIDAKL